MRITFSVQGENLKKFLRMRIFCSRLISFTDTPKKEARIIPFTGKIMEQFSGMIFCPEKKTVNAVHCTQVLQKPCAHFMTNS
jgi:hypothetical protein